MKTFIFLTLLTLAAVRAEKPNIVFILADDLGYGDLSCYGATKVRTPNLDRLAKEGRRFTDAHSPDAWCTPSRYALLTGRFYWRLPAETRAHGANPIALIQPGETNLASLLKAQGYRTAAIGKWHLGFQREGGTGMAARFHGPLRIGFDRYFGIPVNHGYGPHTYIDGERPVHDPRDAEAPRRTDKKDRGDARIDDLMAATLTEKAVAFLEEKSDAPFFLYFAMGSIHAPVTPHARFRGQSAAGLYGDFLAEMDWCVGRVLETLDARGVAKKTLLMFSSDNGGVASTGKTRTFSLRLANDQGGRVQATHDRASAEALKAGHRMNGPWRGGKHDIFEGGSRVPFLARWPGHIPAGTESSALLCLADVLATVAAIAETPLPADAGKDSRNQLAEFLGKAEKPARESLVTQGSGTFALREGPWKLVEGLPPEHRAKGKRAADGERALFNLADDPGETRNVLATHPEIAARLQKRLDEARR
jgi:arylsulfatase A-like enzyme